MREVMLFIWEGNNKLIDNSLICLNTCYIHSTFTERNFDRVVLEFYVRSDI